MVNMSPESSNEANIEALALLTATYNDAMPELIRSVLREAKESGDGAIEGLANSISVLVDLLAGKTVIARRLAGEHARTLGRRIGDS